MLDARYVADHLDEVKAALEKRNPSWGPALDRLAALSDERRRLIADKEQLAAERNQANQEMSALAKSGDKAAFEKRRDELRVLSERVKSAESALEAVLGRFETELHVIPNVPHPGAPVGSDEAANRVVREWGKKPTFDFEPQAHYDLAGGALDFERGAKLSGARFTVLWGLSARLERALGQFMLDVHTEQHGYTEVGVPLLVRGQALFGTGNLPKFEKDLFKTGRQSDGTEAGDAEAAEALYLIPTAEVPVTNLHADEILEPGSLPRAYAALTPCFRSEAGSHGRDVRGLIRQHQFYKVEVVRLVEPEKAEAEHELLTSHAEAILQMLGLHYRVVELCTGDLGFSSQKTYDLEVWLPSQKAYREISSCSWFGDFQARRTGLRYRTAPKEKPRFLHTLNGSGLAVGRTLIAIFEQYQNADGSVTVPAALRPRVGVDVIAAEPAR